MALGRRQFLQAASLGGFGLLAPDFHQLVAAAETDSWFQNPLALPPLEEGRLIDGARRFDLTLQYGVDDIPLVLQDRSFNQDGSLRYTSSMHDRMMGVMGQYMLVNGTTFARFKAQKPLTRFRILNGSNARIYNLEFEDQREFLQIATDGGLLEQPVALRSSILAPGGRIKILVEFAPGENVMLRHKPLPQRPGAGTGMMGQFVVVS